MSGETHHRENRVRQNISETSGMATLEAALFIGLFFLPVFMLGLNLWSYLNIASAVETEVLRLGPQVSTINLQVNTGNRGTFPRDRRPSQEDDFSPYTSYQETAKRLDEYLRSFYGVLDVHVEVGFLSERLATYNGAPLSPSYSSDFSDTKTPKPEAGEGVPPNDESESIPPEIPDTCRRWDQPGTTSTFVVCSTEKPPEAYKELGLWEILSQNVADQGEVPIAQRPPFLGRAWTARVGRRVQRQLGSSVWMTGKKTLQADESSDGNTYAWLNHPRFGVISGYTVTITLDNYLVSVFQDKDTPTIKYWGTFPLRQEL